MAEETKTAPELPPLDDGTWNMNSPAYNSALVQRERQLSDALREIKELRAQLAAKDERIAELEPLCLQNYSWFLEVTELAKEAVAVGESAASRVAELEATLKSIREQVVEKPTRFRSQGASWDYYECSEVDPLLEHYAQQVAALQLKTRKAGD